MKRILSFLWGIMLCLYIQAQFPYGTTGLLHMPTADMQRDKTVMVGSSFLHEGATPARWNYNTYNYYLNITILPFFEVGYACTLLRIAMPGMDLPEKFRNQDRQFSLRLRALKEGQFWQHMPAVVIGGNDVLTTLGVQNQDYMNASETGNGYWNRWYLAATKHLNFYGELGVHAAYVYNRRADYRLNGVALGANWKPQLHPAINVMAEYDSRTVNCGLAYTLWKDHINVVTELNDFKYLSAGLYFKIHLK